MYSEPPQHQGGDYHRGPPSMRQSSASSANFPPDYPNPRGGAAYEGNCGDKTVNVDRVVELVWLSIFSEV